MTDNDPIVRARWLTADVLVVELYLWRPDGTIDWYPSIHNGEIDPTVIEGQVRAHNART